MPETMPETLERAPDRRSVMAASRIRPPLPTEINTATRPLHTELNRLIIDRLPLALPPTAADPTLYALGIQSFAKIYLDFEQCFQDLICATLGDVADTQDLISAQTRDPHARHTLALRASLSTLIPPGLWRTQRLEDDLASLQERAGLATLVCKPLDELSEHMHDVARFKPHVLVAYTWVMYMAIFSGGRWIRHQLVNTPDTFWGSNTRSCYSLFDFDGPDNGEDIKTDYKTRLDAVELLLTDTERAEIIEEAKRLFQACIDIVLDLDTRTSAQIGTAGASTGTSTQLQASRSSNVYITHGLHPIFAFLAICLGCASWYGVKTLGIL